MNHKEFLEKYPSLEEDTKRIMSIPHILQYIAVTGGYFATKAEIEKYLVDKQKLIDTLNKAWNKDLLTGPGQHFIEKELDLY